MSLTQEQQEAIYRMCKIAGVDYYLVLATIAHESNSDPDAKNDLGTKGWMQVSGTAWDSYTQKGGEYYSDDRIQEIYDVVREKEGEEAFKDAYDPLSNAAAGIAQYYVWQTRYTYSPYMSQVVNHYGEGGNLNEGSSENWYPILAPSAIEVLYYRDILAMQDGKEPWYMGVFYNEEGEQITNVDEKKE